MKKTIGMLALALVVSAGTLACKKKAPEAPAATETVEAPAAPVETVSAASSEVQQKVADALKDFPNVQVSVNEAGELTLTGDVTADQARMIKQSVDALKVGKVNFNYNVK